VQPSPGPRPFDVSSRQLIDRDPSSWLAWVGLPADGPVQPLDSEVSTVLAEVDKVLQVNGPAPWLVHLELQASRDERLPLRLLEYHALLLHRHRLPVASVVILLRPLADGPELSGEHQWHDALGELTIAFRYRVMRVWQRPVDELLNGGLGLLPLAPLAAVERDQLPSVVDRMAERLAQEAGPDEAGNLWSATLLLMGLRYDEAEARELLRGVRDMRESVTYQAIVEEGREEGRVEGRLLEAQRFLVRMATRKLGPPNARAAAIIQSTTDVERIELLGDRLLTANSWDELLATGAAD
jgi:predicted transposase YdaD